MVSISVQYSPHGTYLQWAWILHPSSIKHDLFGLISGLYGDLREEWNER